MYPHGLARYEHRPKQWRRKHVSHHCLAPLNLCRTNLTVCSGAYFFIGGPFLLISGLLEFFLGNTFTFVVFISYG